jgi:hypothetical protein
MAVAPSQPFPYYNIACIKCMRKKAEECLTWLQKAVGMGYSDWKHASRDPDLRIVRETYLFKFGELEENMKKLISHPPGWRPSSFIWWHGEAKRMEL